MIRKTADTITDDELDALVAERDALASDLAELTRAREHGAFMFCPQLVGHVTVTEFATKIAEKREALAQRAEAVEYARRMESERDQYLARLTKAAQLAAEERDRSYAAERAIARLRAWCDELDDGARLLTREPSAVHPVAAKIRARLDATEGAS